MMRVYSRHRAWWSAPALLVCLVAGCSYLGLSDPTPRYVGTESLERIDKGATGDDWVLAVFGQPTAKARLSDNMTEIWKYPYEYADGSGGRMRLLGSDEGKGADRVIFVQISHGIVTDWWRD
ncbi:MAG: hypothetical protein ACF8GE_11085 [Phycisphaerales bacterium JB043]